jgi:hypothetical protein
MRNRTMNHAPLHVVAPLLGALLAACGGGGGGGGNAGAGAAANAQQALQAEIDQRFPYTPDQPLDVLYVCSRSNSRLTYYIGLNLDGSFNAFFETDTFQQVSFTGRYTHAGGAIHLVADPNPALLLDETTTRIVPHLGIAAEISTPLMQCAAVAHGYNDPATDTFKSYDCPLINRGAASDEVNSLEFNDASSPFPVVFRGGIFRQRDVNIYAASNPTVYRGHGIFRRVGDTFYADFGNQFPDLNLLKGSFGNADRTLGVEQLEPAAGPCNLR